MSILNIVDLNNNQNISGIKTFIGGVNFSGKSINLIDTELNLSGVGDMTFSGTNINFINSPVYISGTDLRLGNNAIISENLYVNQTGIFNAVDLNNVDNLNLSGVDISLTNANITYSISPRTSGVNFIPDASIYTFFDFVLTGNSTLNVPTNMNNGQSITIFLNQDSSGSRSISFNNAYLFSNGINPSLNFVPSGVDIMQVIRVNNKYFCTFASNY
jgi:hypothetical protein